MHIGKINGGLGTSILQCLYVQTVKGGVGVGGLDSTVRAKVSRQSSDLLAVCCQKPTG